MYCIVKRDYKTGKLIICDRFTSLREAQSEIEGKSFEIVRDQEGEKNAKIFKSSVSGKCGLLPFGFVICKSLQKYIKLTIIEKKTDPNSWISGFMIRQVCSFQICEDQNYDDTPNVEREPCLREEIFQQRCLTWHNVHAELLIVHSNAVISKKKWAANLFISS
jgi:hypothetical protein